MTLKAILEETVAGSVGRIPPESMKVMIKSAADLEAEGIGNCALRAGDQLPEAELINALGESVTIASLLAQGPLVINFYRGGWCPYCNFELKAYQSLQQQFQSLGAQLVAITPENPDNSLTTIEKNELSFPVLTDAGNMFADALGISFELPEALTQVYQGFGIDLPGQNADSGWSLRIPAVFVVMPDGEIILAHVERDCTTRLEPSDALAALKASLNGDS